MSVIQFPRSETDPTLIRLAPQAYVRRDPYMGLMEAIAWVGSRDKRFSDAAYWYLHEREDRRRDDSFPLWYLMNADLPAHYNASIKDAEAEVVTSGLPAFGRFQGGGFEAMDPLLWVDVQLAFDDVPDSIRPRDIRNNLGKPLWSHIRFKREDVLARWPESVAAEPVEAEAADPPATVSRSEFRSWIVDRIKADERLSAVEKVFRSAFPGKIVKFDRDTLRDMWREEYRALRGDEVRPGKRVMGD